MKELKIQAIGEVQSTREEKTGAGLLFIEVYPQFRKGLLGIEEGDELQILYWMHRLSEEKKNLLLVHPMGDRNRPRQGVFSLRSPVRPNPIGSSVIRVIKIRATGLLVQNLDALEGSPVIDIKGI